MTAVAEPVRVRPVPPVQAALRVGALSDPLEKEADAVADRVLRMPEPAIADALLQRCPGGCPGEEELRRQPVEEEEDELQRQPVEEEEEELLAAPVDDRLVPTVPAGTAAGIDAARGGGSPLPAPVRRFFAPRLGADLLPVRVHADGHAASLAASVNARAFTVGRDVFFGAGEYRPGTASGGRLLAHELAHTVQQGASPRTVQRQVAPTFRDCTPAITGETDAGTILEAARDRARGFVGAATRALNAAPAAGTAYATAAQRHFVGPSAAQRTAIQATYTQIMRNLTPRNFICNSGAICGTEQAFWLPADDLIHVCRPFWSVNRTCQAAILIHEAAHDAGIDAGGGGHAPNRGSAQYPAGNTGPPVGQTTALRMGNADAYAFFAAHVWRQTDTGLTCF